MQGQHDVVLSRLCIRPLPYDAGTMRGQQALPATCRLPVPIVGIGQGRADNHRTKFFHGRFILAAQHAQPLHLLVCEHRVGREHGAAERSPNGWFRLGQRLR